MFILFVSHNLTQTPFIGIIFVAIVIQIVLSLLFGIHIELHRFLLLGLIIEMLLVRVHIIERVLLVLLGLIIEMLQVRVHIVERVLELMEWRSCTSGCQGTSWHDLLEIGKECRRTTNIGLVKLVRGLMEHAPEVRSELTCGNVIGYRKIISSKEKR